MQALTALRRVSSSMVELGVSFGVGVGAAAYAVYAYRQTLRAQTLRSVPSSSRVNDVFS